MALVVSALIMPGQLVLAQDQAALQAQEQELEREFTDPLSTLPQVIIRDSYTSANYGPCTRLACFREYETNQFKLRIDRRIPATQGLPH
jgi:hypothetical protein